MAKYENGYDWEQHAKNWKELSGQNKEKSNLVRKSVVNLVFYAIIKMYRNQILRTEPEFISYKDGETGYKILLKVFGERAHLTREEFEGKMEDYGYNFTTNGSQFKYERGIKITKFYEKKGIIIIN